MILHDQHVHSYYSFDSEQPIEEYLIEADKIGVSYFVLTDHLDLNYLDKGEDISFDIQKQNVELLDWQKKYPHIKILRGIEIGYKPSEINRIKEIIKNNHFDVINFSLHESDGIDYFFKDEFVKRGIDEVLKIYFQRELEAVQHYNDYDVFCHLDYGFKTAYLIDSSINIKKYEDMLIKIMQEVIKHNKTLELNVKVQELISKEHTLYILNLYKKLGGKYLTLSSDAHEIKRFRQSFDYYMSLIKQCGFDSLCYFVDRKRKEFVL